MAPTVRPRASHTLCSGAGHDGGCTGGDSKECEGTSRAAFRWSRVELGATCGASLCGLGADACQSPKMNRLGIGRPLTTDACAKYRARLVRARIHNLLPCVLRSRELAGHGFGDGKERRAIVIRDIPQTIGHQSKRVGEGQCLIERVFQIADAREDLTTPFFGGG
jgi:hypothetical protein